MIVNKDNEINFFILLYDNFGNKIDISGALILNVYGVKFNAFEPDDFIGSYTMEKFPCSKSKYFYNLILNDFEKYKYILAKYNFKDAIGKDYKIEDKYNFNNRFINMEKEFDNIHIYKEICSLKNNINEIRTKDDSIRIATILSELNDMRTSLLDFQEILVKMMPEEMIKKGLKK